MNETLASRFAALSGLMLAAALATWWLGSARLAIDQGADAARGSADALHAAWLVRALLVPVLALRVGALRGWRGGASASLAMVAPSWPVVMLAWSASAVALGQSLVVEGFLLVEALALPLLGQGVRRVVPRSDLAEPIATALGVALAVALWLAHERWAFSSSL